MTEKTLQKEVKEEEIVASEKPTIALTIRGDEEGSTFELGVYNAETIKEAEETFLRIFERVAFLLNGKEEKRKEVV